MSSFWISTVSDRITSGRTADTIVRSSAPMKTGRQTTARISRGYWCARAIQSLRFGGRGRRFRRWNLDRFIRGEQLDQPAIASGLGDMNLHRISGLLRHPEIDRIHRLGLECRTHQRIQLVAAHLALDVKRVLVANLLGADHFGLLNRRAENLRNAGPGKQDGAVETGIGGCPAE